MSTSIKKKPVETRENVVILFAGDSGDGILPPVTPRFRSIHAGRSGVVA